jgi:ribosomal protein L40E
MANWVCRNCKSENPPSMDVCIRCQVSKEFDPDEETKIMPPILVERKKPKGTIDTGPGRDEDEKP